MGNNPLPLMMVVILDVPVFVVVLGLPVPEGQLKLRVKWQLDQSFYVAWYQAKTSQEQINKFRAFWLALRAVVTGSQKIPTPCTMNWTSFPIQSELLWPDCQEKRRTIWSNISRNQSSTCETLAWFQCWCIEMTKPSNVDGGDQISRELSYQACKLNL